jgi:Tetratricopeptide repeat
MFKRFQIFLGPRNFKVFIALFAITGLGSLILNAIIDQYDWVAPAQTWLVVAFLIGASYLILSRLPAEERKRWLGVIIPAVIAIIMGSTFFPQITGLFVGAGIGWIVAGIFVFNSFGAPQHYKKAIKAMRKQEYDVAIEAVTELIKQEPNQPEHYRFRAELFRLWGKLKMARKDYLKMAELDNESAVAYNGLAEVDLQARNFKKALDAAQKAHELAPDEWVAVYNLGMIEDRMKESELAVEHLNQAIELKIPDSRHRLLVHLYRARAYMRLGDESAASQAFDAMKREKSGLEEWQVIMSADEAKALRDVLQSDIDLATALIDGDKALSALAVGVHS